MFSTTANSANDYAKPIGVTRTDHGLAGALKDLAYAAIQPLRYRRLYKRIYGDLVHLNDDTLYDLGLTRREVASYAHSRSELRFPARVSLRDSLAGVASAAARALQHRRARRGTIYDLMVLDDRMLKDIGLSRCQIPWIAEEIVRSLEGSLKARAGRWAGHGEAAVGGAAARLTAREVASAAKPRQLAAPANDGRLRKAS